VRGGWRLAAGGWRARQRSLWSRRPAAGGRRWIRRRSAVGQRPGASSRGLVRGTDREKRRAAAKAAATTRPAALTSSLVIRTSSLEPLPSRLNLRGAVVWPACVVGRTSWRGNWSRSAMTRNLRFEVRGKREEGRATRSSIHLPLTSSFEPLPSCSNLRGAVVWPACVVEGVSWRGNWSRSAMTRNLRFEGRGSRDEGRATRSSTHSRQPRARPHDNGCARIPLLYFAAFQVIFSDGRQ